MERTEQFDFAFIDADKTEYIDYFEETLPRTAPERPDHARQHAARRHACSTPATATPPGSRPSSTTASPQDDRVDVALLGFADGITMVRKR